MSLDKSLWKVEKKLDTNPKWGKYFIPLTKIIIPEHKVLIAEEVNEETLQKNNVVEFQEGAYKSCSFRSNTCQKLECIWISSTKYYMKKWSG